ncbi:MAG: DUF1893 domain-containing protein [Dehalococcoidia bacterium]
MKDRGPDSRPDELYRGPRQPDTAGSSTEIPVIDGSGMSSRMEDGELARSLLEKEKWNLVVVRDGLIVLSSRDSGVAPFFGAVRSMAESLHNAAVADRVVGSAVAMLCLHARLASVYAVTASQGALDILMSHRVPVTCTAVVPYISNRAGTDLCPFEKLARDAESPARLFSVLESVFGGSDDDGKTLPR